MADKTSSTDGKTHGTGVKTIGADDRRTDDRQPGITREELDRLLAIMSHGCDAVRVVEPSACAASNYDPATGKLRHPYRCYSALGKGRRCDNCISARTVDTGRPASKFEFVGPDAYFITAHYVEVDGEPRSIEAINKVSADAGLPDDLSAFAMDAAGAASRSAHDGVTGAYNRTYFDTGIRSLEAQRVVVIRIANYFEVGESHGQQAANRLAHAVAAAVQRSVRAQDTLIRYEPDVFYLQFDNLPADVFGSRLHAVYEAARSACAENDETPAPDVRVVGIERDGKASELVADALRLIDQTDAKTPVALERDPQTPQRPNIPVAAPEEHLFHAADGPARDRLTGLLSYQRFLDTLREALHDDNVMNTDDGQVPPVRDLVIFDVEDLKAFNHARGFREGDIVLRCLADALRDEFPAEPTARLGTDHFAVLAPRSGLGGHIGRIHQKFLRYRPGVPIEVKAGVAPFDSSVSDAQILLDRAKVACDSIKGRYDRFVRRYDEDLDRSVSTGQYVITRLPEALASETVRAYYQPIVRAATGDVCAFEALARWDDPVYGLLPPASFVGVLERARLIHRLDRRMLELVCRDLAAALAAGRPVVPVSVNLSPLDFSLMDVCKTVTDTCDRFAVPHGLVNLEVTESVLAEEKVRSVFARLHDAGFEIWLDDFGTGYSSLSMLKDYRFDVLKVDMGFLEGLDRNQRARDVLVSVLDLARRLGSCTLVEGVETEEERLLLQHMGCEMLQGYLFRPPTPLELNPAGELVLESAHGRR